MQEPQLTPEIEEALERYLEIQDQLKYLEEERKALQQKLADHLSPEKAITWRTKIAGSHLHVRCKKETEINYNENLLKKRLGERYVSILKADPTKIRRHLGDIEHHLQPVLNIVGSPAREKVRSAITLGLANKDEFAGAYEKKTKYMVSVTKKD